MTRFYKFASLPVEDSFNVFLQINLIHSFPIAFALIMSPRRSGWVSSTNQINANENLVMVSFSLTGLDVAHPETEVDTH